MVTEIGSIVAFSFCITDFLYHYYLSLVHFLVICIYVIKLIQANTVISNSSYRHIVKVLREREGGGGKKKEGGKKGRKRKGSSNRGSRRARGRWRDSGTDRQIAEQID